VSCPAYGYFSKNVKIVFVKGLKIKWWQAAVVLVILGGMAFTIKDYERWRHAEWDNYGHGPGEMKPAWVLSQLYQNDLAKLRIRYPENWKTYTYPDYRTGVIKNMRSEEVVRFFNQEAQVVVKVKGVTGNLTDLVNSEALKRKNEGWIVDGDWQNWNIGDAAVTAIVWKKGGEIKIQALAVVKGRLINSEWNGVYQDKTLYMGTFRGMLESLVML
jgi:hypothetical protein